MMFRAPAPEVYHLLDCPIANNQRWLSVVEYANLVRGLSLKDRLLNDIPLKRMLLGLRLLHKRCHSLHSALEREITDHEELRERFEAASEGVVELKSRLTSTELEVELFQDQCAGWQADLEAARVELAKAPRVDHDQAAAIEGVAELKATKRRLRSERNELRATLEATRSDLTAARDAAELATQRADSVTRERDELHIQLEELKAALVSRFGVTEAERLVSSSQRLSYQAPSGSSEVTGLRPSPPRSFAEGGMARSRVELITPGLVRTHSEGRHDGGAASSGLRIPHGLLLLLVGSGLVSRCLTAPTRIS